LLLRIEKSPLQGRGPIGREAFGADRYLQVKPATYQKHLPTEIAEFPEERTPGC
jgi:hypothetical protein